MSSKEYNPQMHTVEHILNATLVKMFGCERAFTTHIERKKSKIDILMNRALTAEEVTEIEERVNATIQQHLDVREEFISYNEAGKIYNLSRIPTDSLNSPLRIIHIGNYDSTPCIGEHLTNTNECNGTFKIISTNYTEEKEVLRIIFKVVKEII